MGSGPGEPVSMNIGNRSLMGAFHLITLWVRMSAFMNLVFPVQSCLYLGEELLEKGIVKNSSTILEDLFLLIQVSLWYFDCKLYMLTFQFTLHNFLCQGMPSALETSDCISIACILSWLTVCPGCIPDHICWWLTCPTIVNSSAASQHPSVKLKGLLAPTFFRWESDPSAETGRGEKSTQQPHALVFYLLLFTVLICKEDLC